MFTLKLNGMKSKHPRLIDAVFKVHCHPEPEVRATVTTADGITCDVKRTDLPSREIQRLETLFKRVRQTAQATPAPLHELVEQVVPRHRPLMPMSATWRGATIVLVLTLCAMSALSHFARV